MIIKGVKPFGHSLLTYMIRGLSLSLDQDEQLTKIYNLHCISIFPVEANLPSSFILLYEMHFLHLRLNLTLLFGKNIISERKKEHKNFSVWIIPNM